MKLSFYTPLALGLLLAMGGTVARATPINGEINFNGVVTTDTGSLATATDFTSITDTSVDPATQTGSYASVAAFTPVTFTPFSFSSGSVSPLWTFTSGGLTYSFSATSINIITQSATFLNLSGAGVASITGPGSTYTSTAGTWSITDTGNGPNFTFGAGVDVPDSGTTALLIGLGIAGLGLGMITRRNTWLKGNAWLKA